jgi:hypothetical protein
MVGTILDVPAAQHTSVPSPAPAGARLILWVHGSVQSTVLPLQQLLVLFRAIPIRKSPECGRISVRLRKQMYYDEPCLNKAEFVLDHT